MTHYGAKSENLDSFERLEAKSKELEKYLVQGPCSIIEYDSYYDYVKLLPNTTYDNVVRKIFIALSWLPANLSTYYIAHCSLMMKRLQRQTRIKKFLFYY